MKFLVVISCIIAAASAGLVIPYQYQHLPLLNVDGTPVEPIPNQIARQQHAIAHLDAHARNGDALIAPIYGHGLLSTGVPAELPANQIALAQHAAAHLDAHLRNGEAVLLARKRRGLYYAVPQHIPLLDASGVPVEPLENQIARAQHANAHLNAQLRNGDVGVVLLGRKRRSLYAVEHLPTLNVDGTPVEPIANQVARIQHANARLDAQVRNGDLAVVSHVVPTTYASHVVPTTYAAYGSPVLGAHLIAPVAEITHNGNLPVDTAEVAIAKAEHLATKAAIVGGIY